MTFPFPFIYGGGIAVVNAKFGALIKVGSDITTFNAGNADITNFSTTVYDYGVWYPTNNGRLVVPTPVSRVRVSAGVYITSVSQALAFNIWKNGAALPVPTVRQRQGFTLSNEIASMIATYDLDVTPGDYFTIRLVSGDTSVTLKANGTWFAIERVFP